MSKADENGIESFVRQGSLRRVIPGEHIKENVFAKQKEDFNKIYKKIHQEYIILAEYKMIQTEDIQGVYVIPSRENFLAWFGVIFIRSGLYEDGVFRFNIILDPEFPDINTPPKVIFQSNIYHPVIDIKTNELNLKNAFPKWDKSEQHLWQVLKFIQWIFNSIENSFSHVINNEALYMYQTQQNEFTKIVKKIVSTSQEHLYDEPPNEDNHYITFKQYDAEIHDATRALLLTQVNDDFFKAGHSWVLPGTLKSLGRPPSPDSEHES